MVGGSAIILYSSIGGSSPSVFSDGGFFKGIMGRFQQSLARFFYGRRGTDQLSLALILTSFILSLLSAIFAIPFASYITFAMWAWALFRMLSKNIQKRERENQWFLSKYTPIATAVRQAKARFKNRKIYLYYRCPQCKAWLKLPRHCGVKNVTCGKCGAKFQKEA